MQAPLKYPDIGTLEEAPLPEHCPSCGADMPVDGEGGYNCEVYGCEGCGQIICEDCRYCPADFLGYREYLALTKYFSDLGYKWSENVAVAASYCKACLTGVEMKAVEAIPRGELLIHTNDMWWSEGARQAYNERLSKGE